MALNTSARATRERGGLDHEDDHLLFRLPSPAALDRRIMDAISLAAAYLGDRVSSTYYTGSPTANSGRDELFKATEQLIALHFACLPLKSRKVFGSHWALDSETSERYQELIDQEFLSQAELLIQPYVEITEPGEVAFALPALTATQGIDSSTVDSIELQIQRDIDLSLGIAELPGALLP
jgi:hypothetical protein